MVQRRICYKAVGSFSSGRDVLKYSGLTKIRTRRRSRRQYK
ncbi:hypothetical protein [Neisseria meningitidis]|nr:hypothetical protein [Neisseria meningitidis]